MLRCEHAAAAVAAQPAEAVARAPAGPAVLWWIASTAEVPLGDDWLGPRERVHLAALRIAKRRLDWRLGRWCAKQALRAHAGLAAPAAEIEVLADPDGAPRAWRGDRTLPCALSLSHRDGLAACAVAAEGLRLGCDLEVVEPRSDGFVEDFFTESEHRRTMRLPPARRPLHAALVWSAKESALKALRTGLRRDTRSVEVIRLDDAGAAPADGWRALTVRDAGNGALLPGWWRGFDRQVLTVVAEGGWARPPLRSRR